MEGELKQKYTKKNHRNVIRLETTLSSISRPVLSCLLQLLDKNAKAFKVRSNPSNISLAKL